MVSLMICGLSLVRGEILSHSAMEPIKLFLGLKPEMWASLWCILTRLLIHIGIDEISLDKHPSWLIDSMSIEEDKLQVFIAHSNSL